MNLFSPEMSISISRLYEPDRPHSETLFVYIIIVIKKRVMKQRTAKTPFEQIDWNSWVYFIADLIVSLKNDKVHPGWHRK